ncbi:5-oxoprolinase subunit B family protein [Streptacidiphilus monticola]|uniref:Allophanate hydrolase subunit 1 n=1 Tax=Streptacidiphilus monticola TaxID=2161674 RepID=A0ABW1G9T7_9ACTN
MSREVRPVGRDALLVELPDGPAVAALHAELSRRREAGELGAVRELVPGACTLLLDGVAEPARLARLLGGLDVPSLAAAQGPRVTLDVVFDGADLDEVAGLWRLDRRGAVRVLCATEFRVAFCGFAPGFGYLTGLPPHLHVPRRATPRTRVPAGAVALAGPYAGVYPRESPGGWQLLGRVPDPSLLWDVTREPPALLAPGTGIRFREVAG